MSIKSLPKNMAELLMDCHEREMLKSEPLLICSSPSSKGLLRRGLIEAREFEKNGKKFYGFFITSIGIEFLENL